MTGAYKRGTVAMAERRSPNSQGSQFFIVLDDLPGLPESPDYVDLRRR